MGQSIKLPVLAPQDQVFVATPMAVTSSAGGAPWAEGLGLPDAVWPPPGHLSAIRVSYRQSFWYGAFVWARGALNHQTRRFLVRAGPRQRLAQPLGLGVFYQLYCVAAIEAAVTGKLLTTQEDIVNQFEIATALLDITHADMLEPVGELEPEVN